MIYENKFFNGPGNRKIYYQTWFPETTPKAAVLIVHGLSEHSGRYSKLASILVSSQYAVYGIDNIGHGKSDGRRAFITDFNIYRDTIKQYYDIIRESISGPIFMLGHSMGGLIAASYLLKYQTGLSGAILSSPALKPPKHISKATIFLGNIISSIAPKLGVMKLNSSHISTDKSIADSYREDPLVYKGRVSARLSSEMIKAMKNISINAQKIELPILIMQGGDDKIVDPEGAKNLYNLIASNDKELKIYKGLYHEILNETDNKEIIQDLKSWISKHC